MRQYLDAVKTVLEKGTRKSNRTGVDTLSTFNVNYSIDLQRGFPLLTTKRVAFRNIVVEMLWFLSGRTDIGILKKHKCGFWDSWADDKGEVPSAYGNFWRKFPVHTDEKRIDKIVWDYSAFNDQLAWVIDELKRNPMSRRMVVSAWAPGNAQTSKLPPCHCLFVVNVQNHEPMCPHCRGQGIVEEGVLEVGMGGSYRQYTCPVCDGHRRLLHKMEPCLCLHLTQRFCDIALGVPYNIASYALLMHLLSRFSGIPVGTFGHTLVDAHAYTCKADGSMAEYDHVPGLREQLAREPRKLPRLEIADSIQSLADVEALIDADTEEVMRHFVLHGYEPHEAINFKVAV